MNMVNILRTFLCCQSLAKGMDSFHKVVLFLWLHHTFQSRPNIFMGFRSGDEAGVTITFSRITSSSIHCLVDLLVCFLIESKSIWKLHGCKWKKVVLKNLFVDFGVHNACENTNVCWSSVGNSSPHIHLVRMLGFGGLCRQTIQV